MPCYLLLIFVIAVRADVCKITANYRNADVEKNEQLADWKTVKTVYDLRDECVPWCCEFENCEGVRFRVNKQSEIQCYPYTCPAAGCNFVKSSQPVGIFLVKRMPDPTTVITTTEKPTTTPLDTTAVKATTTPTKDATTKAAAASTDVATTKVATTTTAKPPQMAAMNIAGLSIAKALNVIFCIFLGLYLYG